MKIIILFINYFIFNKDKSKFILLLIRTTKFQSTICFIGQKMYNNIIFDNI